MHDDSKNEISAFINVLGTLFPVVKQITNPEYKYSQTFEYDYGFAYLYFTYEIYIGWRVDQVAVDYGYYNVTYVPYSRAEVYAGANSTQFIVQGDINSYSTLFKSEVPISAQYEFDEFNFCYLANLYYYDPIMIVLLKSEVKECYQDVEVAMRTGDYSFTCNWNTPLYLPLFNNTDEASYESQQIVEKTCWTVA